MRILVQVDTGLTELDVTRLKKVLEEKIEQCRQDNDWMTSNIHREILQKLYKVSP